MRPAILDRFCGFRTGTAAVSRFPDGLILTPLAFVDQEQVAERKQREELSTVLREPAIRGLHMCAYTGRRIDADSCHIEHLRPQAHCGIGEDVHYRNVVAGVQVGDPNHMDLVRVANAELMPGVERFSRFSGAALAGETGEHLLSERAKRASLAEFVACAADRLPVAQPTSDLSTHRLGVSIMAAAYESHIRRGPDHMGAGGVRVDWSE